jgi:Hemerythrin HHE cation binding domain
LRPVQPARETFARFFRKTRVLAGMARAWLTGMDSVSDHLASAHEHMERRLSALVDLLGGGDAQAAREVTSVLAMEMMRHLSEEEEQIFPLLAARLLLVPRTVAMVREHRRIEALLAELREAVAAGELVRGRRCAEDLLVMLEAHHRHEMTELYGWADVLLDPAARARLVRVVEAT